MNRKPRSRRGQGMTEYLLLVTLIAIATIGIITLYGDNVRRLFAMSAEALAGNEHVTNANTANAVANVRLTRRSLKDFASDNAPY